MHLVFTIFAPIFTVNLYVLIQLQVVYTQLCKKLIKEEYCPCCGQYPKRIIMDGTGGFGSLCCWGLMQPYQIVITDVSLSFRNLLDSYHMWCDASSSDSNQAVTKLVDRCFITDKKIRKLLSVLACSIQVALFFFIH